MVQAVSRRTNHGPGFEPRSHVVNTVTPGEGLICEYFDFSLSVSRHQWSALIFIMLFLPEGQTGEAWELSRMQCSFVNRGTFDTKVQ